MIIIIIIIKAENAVISALLFFFFISYSTSPRQALGHCRRVGLTYVHHCVRSSSARKAPEPSRRGCVPTITWVHVRLLTRNLSSLNAAPDPILPLTPSLIFLKTFELQITKKSYVCPISISGTDLNKMLIKWTQFYFFVDCIKNYESWLNRKRFYE